MDIIENKEQKRWFFYLTFPEYFSIIIVICSVIAFFTANNFNYKILYKVAPFFYFFLIIILLFIYTLKVRFYNIIFFAILFLFSLFYTISSYKQNSNIYQSSLNFHARVISDVKYRNGYSDFEVMLIKKGDKDVNISKTKKNEIPYGSKAVVRTILTYPEIRRGSIIEGKGKMSFLNRKETIYNFYLFSKGIDYSIKASDVKVLGITKPSLIYETIFKFKRYIENVCDRIMPYPHSTFATALLTGNRNQIPSYITDIFKKVGTLHILAISGLHVGFIAGMFVIVFIFIGLRHIVLNLVVAIFIIFYVLFIGNTPSVKRAGLMFLFGVLLYILDRDRDYINIIAVVFLILMLFNPRSLYNPGFLLSFFATFGIVYFASSVNKKLNRHLPTIFSLLISMSVAASVYNFPVMITYFDKFPYMSVIANIVIIPFTALIFVLSILMIVFYPIFLPLSILIAHLNSFFISLLFFINIGFSYIPPISIKLETDGNIGIFIYFIILTLMIYYFVKRKELTDEMEIFSVRN